VTLPTDFAGKYAAFIWPAYGTCALVFTWMIVDTLARARHWRAKAERSDDDRPV
jgi:heme exporter protein D